MVKWRLYIEFTQTSTWYKPCLGSGLQRTIFEGFLRPLCWLGPLPNPINGRHLGKKRCMPNPALTKGTSRIVRDAVQLRHGCDQTDNDMTSGSEAVAFEPFHHQWNLHLEIFRWWQPPKMMCTGFSRIMDVNDKNKEAKMVNLAMHCLSTPHRSLLYLKGKAYSRLPFAQYFLKP